MGSYIENKQLIAMWSNIDVSHRHSTEPKKWHTKEHKAKLFHLLEVQK